MTITQTLTHEVSTMEAELCSAFSDSTRILILYSLGAQPRTVTDLTVELNILQPTASRHLKILRERGLVIAERQGNSMLYKLTDRRLIDALDILRSVLRDRIMHRANLNYELNS